MKTTKLHTLAFRLTLSIYALLAWANAHADDPAYVELREISGYIYVTSEDLINSSYTSGGFMTSDNYFYVLPNNKGAIEKSATINFLNGDPQKKLTTAVDIKDPSCGFVFKLAAGKKFRIRAWFQRNLILRQSTSLDATNSNNIVASKLVGDGSNDLSIFEYDVSGVTPKVDSNTNTKIPEYYYLTPRAKDTTVSSNQTADTYFFAIEIIPFVDFDTSFSYNGTTSPIVVDITDPSITPTVPALTASDFTGKYTLSDSTTTGSFDTSKFVCNFGSHAQWWSGEKDLRWTQISLSPDFFSNVEFKENDKIVYTAKPTEDALYQSEPQLVDSWWAYNLNYDSNKFDSDNKLTFTIPVETKSITSTDGKSTTATVWELLKERGLVLNAYGWTITSIDYVGKTSAGADSTKLYTVDQNGIITLKETPLYNNIASVTGSVPEYLISLSEKNSLNQAQVNIFPASEQSVPVKVTSSLSGLLTLDFKDTDPDYGEYIVCHGNSTTLPTLVASFASADNTVEVVPTNSTLTYTYYSAPTYLEPTSIIPEVRYYPDLTSTWASGAAADEGTTTITLYKDESKTSGNTINMSTDIYKNALFYVTAKVEYTHTDRKTYVATKTFPLVIMCPHYTFAKIGSDAKLITGCSSSATTYSDSNPDSTSPRWSGWSGDSNVKPSLYDDLGAYYQSAAWPITYSWCMSDDMYHKYYRIDYRIFADYGDGTTSNLKQATTTSIVESSTNAVTGDFGSDLQINRRGGNGSNDTYIYDALEITWKNNQNLSSLYNHAIYLETKIYAASGSDHDVEGTGILVSKGLYKVILFSPPYITEDEEGNKDGLIDSSNKSITLESPNTSVTGYNKTVYTLDGSLPMNLEAKNLHKVENGKLEITSVPTRTTVFFISDFFNPDYYFYTGEGGNNNTSNDLAVLSRKFMYVVKTTKAYSVQYDTNLIYRAAVDAYGNYETDSSTGEVVKSTSSDDPIYYVNNTMQYNSNIFGPSNTTINNSIKSMLVNDNKVESLHVMLGTQKVLFFNGSDLYFQIGGVQWKVDPDNGFDEYIDDLEQPLGGFTWVPGTGDNTNDYVWLANSSKIGGDNVSYSKDTHGDINPNPYTECNMSLGQRTTEDGGMFLTPMSGDFVRLEPEYDGVITLWIRQNGATDNSTRTTGYMARRPTFIMDEDAIIMKRSTIMPTVESYYCVDGSYADISGRNTFRRDFEETWRFGLLNWNGTSFSSSSNVSGSKDVYRLYSKFFTSVNLDENITEYGTETDSEGNTVNKSITKSDINFTTSKYVDRYDKMSPIIYRNNYMMKQYEEPVYIFSTSFARFGYEVPNFSYARYRIPVRAGKSYYVGGRGTKNGFLGVKFDVMPANYTPSDYAQKENYLVDSNEWLFEPRGTGQKATGTSRPTSEKDILDTYDNTKSKGSSYQTYTITANGSKAGSNELYTAMANNSIANNTTIDVELKREFKAGYWYPIVLPFSVSETRMKELFGKDVAVLYLDPYYNSYNGNQYSKENNSFGDSPKFNSVINPSIGTDLVLQFTRHYYQMLYANTPAFICPSELDSDGNETFVSKTSVTFKRVTFQNSEKANGNKFAVDNSDVYASGYQISPEFTLSDKSKGAYFIKGTYSGTTLGSASDNTDHGIYYMSNSGTSDSNGNTMENVASVYHLSKNAQVTMKPTRVWIEWVPNTSSGNGAPPRLTSVGYQSYEGYELEEAPETNAIYDIIADEVTIPGYADDTVYDMMGRIVAKGGTEGLAPGFYIYQGRKVAVK